MEHYYLLNGTVKKGSEMPENKDTLILKKHEPNYDTSEILDIATYLWRSSLQPCEISGKEYYKINDYINPKYNNPIDITDIIEDKDGKIYFKQPKQVESECEAVDIKTMFEFTDFTILKYIRRNGMYCHKHASQTDKKNWITIEQLYKIFKNR